MLSLFSRGAALVRELETRDSLFLVGPKRERGPCAHISHSVLFLKHIVALCAGGGCLCPLSNSFFFTGKPKTTRTEQELFSFPVTSYRSSFFLFFCGLSVRESPVLFSLMCVSVCIYIYKL